MEYLDFNILQGKTLSEVTGGKFDEEMIFTSVDGEVYKLYHEQDCCEDVTLEDICGDLADLVGTPILAAEEVTHAPDTNPPGVSKPEYQESFTWTFYKLTTIKGSVTIRWYGESNGWYSEDVAFVKVT